MLRISMKIGQYFTVGDNTVVQYDNLTGERVHLTINAPREVPILRGEVLERSGQPRPACVTEKSPHYVRQLQWNGAKKKALLEMRETLSQMGDTPETRLLRQKLDYIFPNTTEGDQTAANT